MPSRSDQVTEAEIGIAALRIAASKTNGIASMDDLKREVPNYVSLTARDQEQSETRPNEEMWEQKVRNLVSHRETEGNIFAEGLAEYLPREGLRITDAGRLHLQHKGHI